MQNSWKMSKETLYSWVMKHAQEQNVAWGVVLYLYATQAEWQWSEGPGSTGYWRIAVFRELWNSIATNVMSLHWKRSHCWKYKLQFVRSIYTWFASVPIASRASTSGADAAMPAAVVPLLADFFASPGTETAPSGYGSSQSGRVLATFHQLKKCVDKFAFSSCSWSSSSSSSSPCSLVLVVVLVVFGGGCGCRCRSRCRCGRCYCCRLQEKVLLVFFPGSSSTMWQGAKVRRISSLRGHCRSLRAETGTF